VADKKCSPAQVKKATEKSGGIFATIAKRLKVHRHTVERYLTSPELAEEYAEARQVLQDEIAMVGDRAKANIVDAIYKGDLEISKWYASTKLKDEGYSGRQELTGKDGTPIEVIHVKPRSDDD